MEKRGKKLLRALLYAVMVLVLAAGLMSAAQAEETCDITAETTAWNIDGAVYRATGNVTIQERVMVTGNITLDLGDDATLTCANGISVPANNSLTIQGTGTLIANASNTATAAGIGGYSDGDHRSSGAITINGGTITATGGQYAAGIGSGMYGYCNPITINGGTITATGGDRGAGIGSGGNFYWEGNWAQASTITITGGTINATGRGTGAGIGSGGGFIDASSPVKGGNVDAIIITGGRTTATSTLGASIGAGLYGHANSITLGWSDPDDYISAGSIIANEYTFQNTFHYTVEGTDYGEVTAENLPAKNAAYSLTPWVPVAFPLSGDGTAESPYLIQNADDWDTLCGIVNGGTMDPGMYFRLNDSISVSTTLGTADHPFSGVFDGNHKTLTADITDTSTICTAPFREIADTTIRDLTVTGSVTGTTHAAGLVGRTLAGTNTLQNCTVSAQVAVTAGSNRHIGGIVGYGSSAALTMAGCVFDGTMSSGGNYAGGLLGWSDGSTLNLTDCLFTGSYSGNALFHPVAVRDRNKTMTGTTVRTYYTAAPTLTDAEYIAAAGQRIWPVTAAANVTMTVSGGAGFMLDGVFHAPAGATVSLSLGCENIPAGCEPAYTASTGELTETDTGYALTLSDSETVISVTFFATLTGEGTAASPYLVSDAEDWNRMGELISKGIGTNAYYRLTESISITGTVGTEPHPFRGIFDGDGHTLTLELYDSENGTAPFRNISGATIKNLKTAGSVSGGVYSSGLVGMIRGNGCCILNCEVAASISSDSNCGGIVGHGGSYAASITDCIFSGSLGSFSSNVATIWGWSDEGASPVLTGCLDLSRCVAPVGLGYGTPTVTGTYYTFPEKYWYNRDRVWDDADMGQIAYTVRTENGITVSWNNYTGIERSGVLYAPEDTPVTFTATAAGTLTELGLTKAIGGAEKLVCDDEGIFTLTVPDCNATICAWDENLTVLHSVLYDDDIFECVDSNYGNTITEAYTGQEIIIIPPDDLHVLNIAEGQYLSGFFVNEEHVECDYPTIMWNSGDFPSFIMPNEDVTVTMATIPCTREIVDLREGDFIPASGINLLEFWEVMYSANYQGGSADYLDDYDYWQEGYDLNQDDSMDLFIYYRDEFNGYSAPDILFYSRGPGADLLTENYTAWDPVYEHMFFFRFVATAPEFGDPDFVLPASLTDIEEEAFAGAVMSVVYIQDTCESIGNYAFRGCANLTQIRIPADCVLGQDVFDGCDYVYVYGTAGTGNAESYCEAHDNCEFVEE